jgi:quercetin dioxygenase-like cupin family protein
VNPLTARKKDDGAIEHGAIVKMINYQKGSIVSKTVIDKKTGTATLFAFDAGQGLSEHRAPYDAMVVILDGVCEIKIAGKLYRLTAGDTITMPANIPHAVNAIKRFMMLLVMIKS